MQAIQRLFAVPWLTIGIVSAAFFALGVLIGLWSGYIIGPETAMKMLDISVMGHLKSTAIGIMILTAICPPIGKLIVGWNIFAVLPCIVGQVLALQLM